jgi:hypothetical protein
MIALQRVDQLVIRGLPNRRTGIGTGRDILGRQFHLCPSGRRDQQNGQYKLLHRFSRDEVQLLLNLIDPGMSIAVICAVSAQKTASSAGGRLKAVVVGVCHRGRRHDQIKRRNANGSRSEFGSDRTKL